MKDSKNFKYTTLVLSTLEKILNSNFSVSGMEKIPDKPILFVANHFTRLETFLVPYLIYKYTGKQIRCLADSGLFFGALGRFLGSVGAISTKNPERDRIILHDLITGEYDWMIYPEGSMIKNKEIIREGGFIHYTPGRIGPVRTGAAVLAIKSQLYRDEIVSNKLTGRMNSLNDLGEEYGVVDHYPHLGKLNTYIVPITITYYPIRPGENRISELAHKFVKRIPKQISEELEIEGNLLTGANVDLSFGEPINMADYIAKTRSIVYPIPIIKNETKNNLIIRSLKSKLTNEFMERVYLNLQINFDHLFVAALYHSREEVIEADRLKRIIYLSASILRKTKKYRLNDIISEISLIKLFTTEFDLNKSDDFKVCECEFDKVMRLAIKQGIIMSLDGRSKFKINKVAVRSNNNGDYISNFHNIRIENTLRVIANEFFLLEKANLVVQHVCEFLEEKLTRRTFDEICYSDLERYNLDYDLYFDKLFSKDRQIGCPTFLPAKNAKSSEKIGILLIHGYKSSPKEMEKASTFFNNLGFDTYCVRLSGHGTAPINLKYTSWEGWYDSVCVGYAALSNICPRIIIIGFSTGGLLSLLFSSKQKSLSKLAAIVSINAALKLRDVRARMVPGINIWNEMLEKFHIDSGKFEYVDDKPEVPETNYSRNYIKGVNELQKLMHICEDSLSSVRLPIMVIQASNDPVVDPKSGRAIYDSISSKEKCLSEVNFSNHVIVNCDKSNEIFEEIYGFIKRVVSNIIS